MLKKRHRQATSHLPYKRVSQGDTLICSMYIDLAAFEVAIFAAFKLKLYYFFKAVILVQFFVNFEVIGISCRIFIAYSIA